MAKISSPLSSKARTSVGTALQSALIDLLDLSLQGKQAHWNLIGPNFRPIHLQLDEVVELARNHADLLAERAVAIGVSPDGRAQTIAKSTQSLQFANGYLKDAEVVEQMVQLLAGIIERFRDHINKTDDVDLVTQDLLLTAAHDIEKQHWMFQAQA